MKWKLFFLVSQVPSFFRHKKETSKNLADTTFNEYLPAWLKFHRNEQRAENNKQQAEVKVPETESYLVKGKSDKQRAGRCGHRARK